MATMFWRYSAALKRRPMLVQSASAAVVYTCGDLIAQQAVERKGTKHDFLRTLRMAFYGGCIFGPIMTKWLQTLGRFQFSSPTRGVIYKVWLDQTIFAPFGCALFFGSMSLLEGKPEEAIPRIEHAYVPTLIRGWSIFIPAQIINFSIMPQHLRFVFLGGVSLCWNTYLSFVNASEKRLQETPERVFDGIEEKVTVSGSSKVEAAGF